ncbi:hypothetical protein Taro_024079 [Colocasia esculenta]|uniref:Uncharacterized protein n=1 Tax=Colocasia esculenta TaxID=4460 RepID=A0A843V5V3_COLES|nr:hypothetical protein [Colocasia esculenta]
MVSRKTTQTSTVPHCTGTNPEHNKHTCLAHKEPGLTYIITYINHSNNNTTTYHRSQSDSEGYTKH